MDELFTIGGFCFRIVCPDEVEPPENFLKFHGGQEPAYTYRISLSDAFPAPEGRVLARREDMLVVATAGGECRYIGVKGNPQPYACYMEMNEREAQILLHPDRAGRLSIDPMFVSLFALERRQILADALILHCAYIDYGAEAILFSAPSETGKTTQANLWEKCRGARTVNGDRALLRQMDGRWHACGWPVCGSSEVCFDEALPVRAIVMLSQSPVDEVRRLAPAQAFSQLFSQITVNRWNRADTVHAMDLTERIVTDLPIYHLGCTMEESAVRVLEQAIYGAE